MPCWCHTSGLGGRAAFSSMPDVPNRERSTLLTSSSVTPCDAWVGWVMPPREVQSGARQAQGFAWLLAQLKKFKKHQHDACWRHTLQTKADRQAQVPASKRPALAAPTTMYLPCAHRSTTPAGLMRQLLSLNPASTLVNNPFYA